jgi:apolipoprotein N-acyltransferase
MHTYGGLDGWAAVIALLALAAALSVYYGAAAHLHTKYLIKSPTSQTLAFSALWTAAELARGTWLTGFGWGAPGYAHTNSPLSIYAPYIGVYGVGALATWIAATLAMSFRVPRWQLGFVLALLGAGIWLRPIDWTQPNGQLSVTLLQGNIAQSEKFEESTGVPAALQWYADAMMHSKSQLTVAPETAIPLLPQELPAEYWASIEKRFATPDIALLTGLPLGNYQAGYTNSVAGLNGGVGYQYDKHHLVPFGEFIPPMFRWFTRLMNIPLGDFNRGALGQPSFTFANQRLAPNICYEDLFGEELGVRFSDTHTAPTIFVNVSNLGWFGGGLVIDQHLQISRMRALEFERPFVSATNTGTTVIIDHKGRVAAALPRLTQGVLTGSVEGRTGVTPFAWWISRFGLWPYWIVISAILFAGWRSKSKQA